MEKDIESQALEAIKEVLNFNDPKTIKASLILARIRTILGLKDLASAPDLYEALKSLACVCRDVSYTHSELNKARQALAKAGGK